MCVTLEDNTDQVLTVKKEIEHYHEEKTKASIFRSKARWYREGERGTKYFFCLEKLRYNQRMMICLVREDG